MSRLSTQVRGVATAWPHGRPVRGSCLRRGARGTSTKACRCRTDTVPSGRLAVAWTGQALPARAQPRLRPCAPAPQTAAPWQPGQPGRPEALASAAPLVPPVVPALTLQPGRGVRPGSPAGRPPEARSGKRPGLQRRRMPLASGLREVVRLLPLIPLRCRLDILMVALWRHCADLSPRVTERGELAPPLAPGRLRRPAAPVAASAAALHHQVKHTTRPPSQARRQLAPGQGPVLRRSVKGPSFGGQSRTRLHAGVYPPHRQRLAQSVTGAHNPVKDSFCLSGRTHSDATVASGCPCFPPCYEEITP